MMKKKIESIDYLFIILLLIILVVFFVPKYFIPTTYGIETCDNMVSNELKLICYSMFLKDYKYCSLLSASYPICADFVSSSFDTTQDCEKFEGYQKISCISSLAIKKKDPNVCSQQESDSLVSSCYYSMSSYLDNIELSEDFCNKISEESLRYVCLTKLERDIKLCENIKQEPFEKGNCLAVASGDLSHCETTSSKDFCILLVALDSRNSSLCEKITTEFSSIDCLVQTKKEISACDKFEDSWKDFCLLTFFKLKNLGII